VSATAAPARLDLAHRSGPHARPISPCALSRSLGRAGSDPRRRGQTRIDGAPPGSRRLAEAGSGRAARECGAGVVGEASGSSRRGGAEPWRCSGGGGFGRGARRRRVVLYCVVRFGWPFGGGRRVGDGSLTGARSRAQQWISA
jgi:hypothetical protein